MVSAAQASMGCLNVYKECLGPRMGQITPNFEEELELIKYREWNLSLTSKRDGLGGREEGVGEWKVCGQSTQFKALRPSQALQEAVP